MAIKITTLTIAWIIVNAISAVIISRVGPRSARPFALALVFLAGSVTPIFAEDTDTLWMRQSLLKTCHRKHDCGKYLVDRTWWFDHRYSGRWGWGGGWYGVRSYYRPYHAWYRYDRYYDYDRREGYSGHCRPEVIATGHEAHSREEAKTQGLQAWMEEVRGRWGARYMDFRNARDLSYECYRSSTGNRESERVVSGIAGFLEQCRIEAIPCRAKKEYADAEGSEARHNAREDSEIERQDRGLYRRFRQWRQERRQRRR